MYKTSRLLVKALLVTLICIGLGLTLTNCQSANNQSATWKIYQNPRYSFEFPYPSNWIAAPIPDNRDGQAFSDPQKPEIEIRGWAGVRLPAIKNLGQEYLLKDISTPAKKNFTTQQGLTGELQVQVELDFSSMTLRLAQGEVVYNWQGRSPSQQFADYYRFFSYIASQYRIPQTDKRSAK